KWPTSIDRGFARGRGVELGFNTLGDSLEQLLYADRSQAIRWWRGKLCFFKCFEKFLDVGGLDARQTRSRGQPDLFAQLRRGCAAHSTKSILQKLIECPTLVMLLILDHLQQRAKLDSLWMRLNLLGF